MGKPAPASPSKFCDELAARLLALSLQNDLPQNVRDALETLAEAWRGAASAFLLAERGGAGDLGLHEEMATIVKTTVQVFMSLDQWCLNSMVSRGGGDGDSN